MPGRKRSRQSGPGVYVLIGHSQDPCCLSLRAALEARQCPTLLLTNPLANPARFSWRLNDEQSVSQLIWQEARPVPDHQIVSVFVRRTGWVDHAGWQPDDFAYMQAEMQAALLAWLWSLPCQVVNRFPPAVWYQPQLPLLAWQRLLRLSGLPTLETLITNVQQEARAFGRPLSVELVAGAVYSPLTSAARYLVSSDHDWNGLTAMQAHAPVCLAPPHAAAQLVCVVGEQVVWDGELSPEAAQLEPALRRFAAAAGLAFVELAFAPTAQGLCVVAVESQPQLEHFGNAARQQILEGLVQLLTAEQV